MSLALIVDIKNRNSRRVWLEGVFHIRNEYPVALSYFDSCPGGTCKKTENDIRKVC